MNIDVIREEAPLPGLTVGDQVVLHPVGAYNITQSMQFITYRPAVVMIDTDKTVHVIRRRENLAYVQELEKTPQHLAPKSSEKKADPSCKDPFVYVFDPRTDDQKGASVLTSTFNGNNHV
jgi:diaminopimelate decarboxylase